MFESVPAWNIMARSGLIVMALIVVPITATCPSAESLCSFSASYSQSFQHAYSQAYSQRYYVSCGPFNWQRCTRHRTAHRTAYQRRYRTAYRIQYQCCPGWQPSGSDCTPICSDGCQHNGTCTSPNCCECSQGFAGNACQYLTNVCPGDIFVETDPGTNGAVATWNEVEVTNTNVSSNHSSGEFFPIGSTNITYRIENATVSGSCSFTIHVFDKEEPNVTCPPDYEGFVVGQISIPVYWPPLFAMDNSGNLSSINCSRVNGSVFHIGTTDVWCQVFDYHGNNGTCEFQVNITARCPPINTNPGIGILSYPQTVAGTAVESNERCPVRSEGRNLALASRHCILNSTYGGVWATDVMNSCGEEHTPHTEHLALTPVTGHNVQEVAEALANITETVSNMTTEEIDINEIQQTLVNIVNVGSPAPEVTDALIETVDHVLSNNMSTGNSNATTLILKSIQQQIAQTLDENGKFSSVQPNVVVEAVTINSTQTKDDVRFTVNSGTSGFTAGSVESLDSVHNDTEAQNMTNSIVLPSHALFETDGETKVSFVGYNDDKLFRSRMLELRNTSIVAGAIISAVVLGRKIDHLDQPVVVRLLPTKVDESLRSDVLNTSECVFWDFDKHDGIGDWSKDGCEWVSTSSSGVTCHCTHLTNFAVLVDLSVRRSAPPSYHFTLDTASKVGCAISVVSLCVTLLIFLLFRRLRQLLPRKILIQFCISLLCLYLVFVSGIDAKSEAGCIIAAALMHYLLLTTAFWMGVEARSMYISLARVDDPARFMTKAACCAWGVPLLPVVVVLAIKRRSYVSDTHCFLPPGFGLYFGLVFPVAVTLFHNAITFVVVIRQLLKTIGNDKTKVEKLTKRLQIAFTINILLGLTWVFGFLAVSEATRAFQILFCVCNFFQAVVVFGLFCIWPEDVRKTLFGKCLGKEQRASGGTTKSSGVSSGNAVKSVSTTSNPVYSFAEEGTTVKKSTDEHHDDGTGNNYEGVHAMIEIGGKSSTSNPIYDVADEGTTANKSTDVNHDDGTVNNYEGADAVVETGGKSNTSNPIYGVADEGTTDNKSTDEHHDDGTGNNYEGVDDLVETGGKDADDEYAYENYK